MRFSYTRCSFYGPLNISVHFRKKMRLKNKICIEKLFVLKIKSYIQELSLKYLRYSYFPFSIYFDSKYNNAL